MYAKTKSAFLIETFYRRFNKEGVQKAQADANNAFISKYSEILKEYSGKEITINKLIDGLNTLNNEAKFTRGKDSYNQIMVNSLGREELIDISQIMPLDVDFSKIENDSAMSRTIDEIIKVFKYLQKGDGEGAIYPMVSTFEYTTFNRDGYGIYHFSLIEEDQPNERVEKYIRVLSEFTYSINEKYYCLPNNLHKSIDSNIWIEPVIINCKNLSEESDENENV